MRTISSCRNTFEDLLLTIPNNDARLGYVYADVCGGDKHGYINHSNLLRYQTREGRHPKQGSAANSMRQPGYVRASVGQPHQAKRIYGCGSIRSSNSLDTKTMTFSLRIYRNGYTDYFLDKPVTVWRRYRGLPRLTL